MTHYRNRCYLITGGAGFIGSNFIDYLYKHEPDANVRVLDKLSYSANLENLKRFEGRKGFEFLRGDICDRKAVKEAMEGIEIVVNFAAEAAVDRSIDNSDTFLQTDIFGVYILLQEARNRRSIKKFVQISTDEVYGEILEGSCSEVSDLKPRNPYSASKLGGERLAYSFFITHHVPVLITRASNTYGPYAYLEKVIPLFITNLLDGEGVPVYGNGEQIRDWLYVEDHCSAIYLLIDKGNEGEVYNIASNHECHNIDLARKLISTMGKEETSISFVGDRPGHDFRYSMNSSKLRSLGWKPNFGIEKGLAETIRWYVENESWWRPLKTKLEKRFVTGYWGAKI